MVKIFAFLFFFSTSALAKSGCFLSEDLNLYFSGETSCEDFPEFVSAPDNGIYLSWSEPHVLHLYEEDINRLVEVEEVYLSGRRTKITIVLHGTIRFPTTTTLELNDIQRIDSLNGSLFLPKNNVRINLDYFAGFQDIFIKGKINPSARIEIDAHGSLGSELDFTGFSSNGSLTIIDANAVRNLSVGGTHSSLTIRNNSESAFTTISNVQFEGYALVFLNVVMENAAEVIDIGNCDQIQPWDYVGTGDMKYGNRILIMNSKLRVLRFPVCPMLNSLVITGNVSFVEVPSKIRITEHLKELNLSSLGLSKLTLELDIPRRLYSIYLMGNSLEDILVTRAEESKFFPGDFKMVVDKKNMAIKLRKTLNRKAIGFIR